VRDAELVRRSYLERLALREQLARA